MKRYCMKITGMGCAHCVKRVAEALEKLGAEACRVELGRADFAFDGDLAAVRKAVMDCGFDVAEVSEA